VWYNTKKDLNPWYEENQLVYSKFVNFALKVGVITEWFVGVWSYELVGLRVV